MHETSSINMEGDSASADRLFPLVYDQLRRLAAEQMSHEKPGQTLNATALVHEAYMRLVGVETARQWHSRGQFFSAAAEAMRHILVDQARRRKCQKRGGYRDRIPLENGAFTVSEDLGEVLAVHEALARFAEVDPQAAELVKLRYFAGLSIPDAAEALHIGARSADRLWAYARAWLRRAIGSP